MGHTLKTAKKVIGAKQTKKAVETGIARQVFIAEDAQASIVAPIRDLCREREVPVAAAPTMQKLGQDCGIAVGAAVAAILREEA